MEESWGLTTEAQAIAQAWTEAEIDAKAMPNDYDYELLWDEHEDWLVSRGYSIQRRAKKSRIQWDDKNDKIKSKDFVASRGPEWREAIRIDDSEVVYLKLTSPDARSEEYAINDHLSRPVASPEPLNHCLRPLEILDLPSVPETKILVLPAYPLFDINKLKIVADVIDFFHQLIEGIIFLHQLHIAYGGCRLDNIVVQTTGSYDDHVQRALRLTPSPTPHMKPRSSSQTRNLKRYYFIDFSRSRGYQPSQASMNVPDEGVEPPKERDLFSTDVYDLGLLIGNLVNSRKGLDFMRPLITDMTQRHQSQRPKAGDVMFRFEAGNRSLDARDLQTPVIPRNSSFFYKLFRSLSHRWHSSPPSLAEPISIAEPWSGSNSEDSSPSSSSQSSGPRLVTVTIKGNDSTPQLPNVKKLRRRPPVPDFDPDHPSNEAGSVQLKVPPTRRTKPPKVYLVDVPLPPDCVVHLDMNPYTKWNCQLCGCNITNKKEFVKHTRSKHPNAPVCGCGKLFNTFEELQVHQADYAHAY